MVHELRIRTSDAQVRTIKLEKEAYSLGRSSSNDLCYPEDSGLSRQHLIFERIGREWILRDLLSKNGTMLNGSKVTAPTPVKIGDKVTCGHLHIECAPDEAAEPAPSAAEHTVVFVHDPKADSTSSTVVSSLEGALLRKDAPLVGPGMAKQMDAVVRAGRELVEHRPLDELFPVILNLAIDAVGAARGVLMTLEGKDLQIRATRGEGFRISHTVRDRVIRDRHSLLVRDTALDQALLNQQSIVENRVKSLMAVPLQTADRVIGLVYLDTPDLVRPFTKDDLNLLTVLANVAAVRIETARLAELEEHERRMQRDLQQAAEIQASLLPEHPPVIPGLELAGYNAACRTVGGDYFDFLKLSDGRVLIIVADVAGKGLPAAMMVSSLQARVHVLMDDDIEIATFVKKLNKAVCQNCPGNRFITFFAGVIDAQTGAVSYCNAGHNPPLLVRANGSMEWLEGTGMILGIVPVAAYEGQVTQLDPGDTLVLFSDGVTEAMPQGSEEEFGEKRLGEFITARRNMNPAELIEATNSHLKTWLAGAHAQDDVTLVIARRT